MSTHTVGRDDGAPNFAENLLRLIGLHAISQHFAAQLLGVSNATMSAWMNGKTNPSLAKAVAAAELFEVGAERLIAAPFEELLANELANQQRFRRVEKRLRAARSPKKR